MYVWVHVCVRVCVCPCVCVLWSSAHTSERWAIEEDAVSVDACYIHLVGKENVAEGGVPGDIGAQLVLDDH